MVQRKRVHVKLFFVEHTAAISTRKFPDCQPEIELEIGGPKRGIQKNPDAFRPENVQRRFAPVEMERTEETGNPVKVIPVKVTDEDRMDAAAPDAGAHELHLRSLTAVEQEDVALTNQCSR